MMFEFRLFIAGATPNSTHAFRNLNALCRKYLPEQHSIEIVDVLREPARALAEGVFMTPMLVRLAPDPVVKIAGTLNDEATLLAALGLQEFAP